MSWGNTYGSYEMANVDTEQLERQYREYQRQLWVSAGPGQWSTPLLPDENGVVRVPITAGPVIDDATWKRMQDEINEAARRRIALGLDFDFEDFLRSGDQEMADAKQQNPVIISPTGYLSFANLFEKRAVVQGGEERYSVNLILDETDQQTEAYKALQKAVMEAAKKFWGDKLPKNIAWPIKDAEEKADKYEGYTKGRKFISAWTKTSPGIIGPAKEDILDKDAIWAGQRARLAVKPFAYDKGGNKGVGLVLDCVQIVKFDMPRIDGKAPAKSLFPDDLGDTTDNDGDDDIPF